MARYGVQLVGGHPVLDFLNTVHDWTVPEARDYLAAFPDALAFGVAAGVLLPAEAKRLVKQAAGVELLRLRQLRARLERVFRALITGRAPPAAELAALARDAARAARAARLRSAKGQLHRVIDAAAAETATLRWRLIESAVALLTSPQLARVSACPSCGWFFLDTSKNRSRRWCSMAMCGNSAKARAYYRRRRSRRRVR